MSNHIHGNKARERRERHTFSKLFLSSTSVDGLVVGERDDPVGGLEVVVHLFELPSFGLRDKQPGDERVRPSTDGKDKVVLPADGVEGIRGSLSDRKVTEPSSHRGDRRSFRTQSGVEDLDGDSPTERTQATREGKVEDPGHHHERPAGRHVNDLVRREGSHDRRSDTKSGARDFIVESSTTCRANEDGEEHYKGTYPCFR